MKFVHEIKKESNRRSFLERFLEKVEEVRKVKDKLLVDFWLWRNPKVGERGWVAKVNPQTGELTFLRAEEWRQTGGKYLLTPGELIIEKFTYSSHSHSGARYTLYKVTSDNLEEIGYIDFWDRTPEFSNETLEEIYVTTPKVEGKLRAVQALITYYKTQFPPEKPAEAISQQT